MTESKSTDLLKDIYYDVQNPNFLSGIRKLYKAAKAKDKGITLAQVKDFLAGEDTYTLHRQYKRPRKYRKTIAYYINDLHQADLIDVSSLSKHNRNYKFLLVNIDVLSRKVYVQPLRNKSAKEILRAFQEIHKEAVPKNLQSDLGKEFHNQLVREYLKSRSIHFFSSYSDQKAAVVERVNRTLKEKMWKYFTKTGKLNYTSVLQDIVQGYNNSKHRSIGVAPNQVNKKNQDKIWNYQYKSELGTRRLKFKFDIGDFVRLVHLDKTFTKKYLPRFTKEIFIIKDKTGDS